MDLIEEHGERFQTKKMLRIEGSQRGAWRTFKKIPELMDLKEELGELFSNKTKKLRIEGSQIGAWRTIEKNKWNELRDLNEVRRDHSRKELQRI